jgi:hypothetical protein
VRFCPEAGVSFDAREAPPAGKGLCGVLPMTKFVGLKKPDYASRQTERIFENNSGTEITTEGVLRGVERVRDAFSGEFVTMIKKSGMFVRETE